MYVASPPYAARCIVIAHTQVKPKLEYKVEQNMSNREAEMV